MKISSILFLLLALGFGTVSAEGSECSAVPQTRTVCHTLLLPDFIENPTNESLGYHSLSLIGERDDDGLCEVDSAVINYNDVLSSKHAQTEGDNEPESKDWDCSFGQVFAEPIKKSEQAGRMFERISGPVIWNEVTHSTLDLKMGINRIIDTHSLQLESVFEIKNVKLKKRLGTERQGSNRTNFIKWSNQWGSRPRTVQRDTLKHKLGAAPFLTSNGCWLIIPSSVISQPKPPENITETYRQLFLLSLNDGVEKPSTGLCQNPKYRLWEDVGTYDPNTGPQPTIVDLLDEPGRQRQLENRVGAGAQFAAFSPLDNPDELHLVYQRGFVSESVDEKNFKGGLHYVVFERKANGDIRSIDEKSRTVIDCGKGWIHSPRFSHDKSRLFFLVMEKPEDDKSNSHLHVVTVDEIKAGMSCNDSVDSNNLTLKFKKLSSNESDYPILDYRLSTDSRRITIIFEEKGESVVRFYKFNKNTNKIIYEYPETISGVGRIYDIASADLLSTDSGHPIYYIFHSRLDFPISISRCYLAKSRFVCGSRYSPVQTTAIGERISNASARPYSSSVSLGREPVAATSQPDDDDSESCEGYSLSDGGMENEPRCIDVFVLEPPESKFNNSAIVSIHGGPFEAWDGRFSPRDYRLASKHGYTVFMPNPIGSTGYTNDNTHAGDDNWGKAIYHDIVNVIQHVSQHEKGFDRVYLMGFSFGGYIVNWIQTERDELIRGKNYLQALISVSGLYDLRDFASSTDQLWFPEFQLNCSDSVRHNPHGQCRNLDCLSDSTSDGYPVLLGQNPACFSDGLQENPIPTFYIHGGWDQRVPPYYNLPNMIQAFYEAQRSPKIKLEKYLLHDSPGHRSIEQADSIHDWLCSLAINVDSNACKPVDSN